jgi:hypothetical protein
MKTFLSILAITSTFLNFHFLYTDNWLFDGSWKGMKKIREKIYPSDPSNRISGGWKAPAGYFCALSAAVLGLLLTLFYE